MEFTAVNPTPPDLVKQLRLLHQQGTKPSPPFYKVEERSATGKATCRACGEAIKEKDKSIFYEHAEDHENRPWLRSRGTIHAEDCGDFSGDWVKCPKCSKQIPNDSWSGHWKEHKFDKAANTTHLTTSANTTTLSGTNLTSGTHFNVTISPDAQWSYTSASGGASDMTKEAMIKTAWNHPSDCSVAGHDHPGEQAIHTGEGEEHEITFEPQEVPRKVPEETPSSPVHVPAEPQKVPVGVPASKRTAGDEALGEETSEPIHKFTAVYKDVMPHPTKDDTDIELSKAVAYRFGNIKKRDDGQYIIESPMVHMTWEKGAAHAQCRTGHKAPDFKCSSGCGIYALFDENEIKEGYTRNNLNSVITQTAHWGNIKHRDKGLRSEYAQITGIRGIGCHYCEMHSGDKKNSCPCGSAETGPHTGPAAWASSAGWAACDAHRKHWDDKITADEGPENAPEWEDVNKITKSLSDYYGAPVYPAGTPMKNQKGYKEPEDQPGSGDSDWDEGMQNELGGFKSHKHIGRRGFYVDTHCGLCEVAAARPINDIDIPLAPREKATGWKKVQELNEKATDKLTWAYDPPDRDIDVPIG